MAEILVIIVTYNGRQWTDRCLGSLRASEVPVDVVVVDNGSSDGSIEYIRSAFPEVKVICAGKNLGFGQANNIGINLALDDGYGYVYLLNQDAWIEPDTIRKLKDAWQPGFGILSPIQKNADGNLDANFRKKCGAFVENAAGGTVVEVPFVMAAHWLINRDALLKVGGFSPAFSQYGEDDNYLDRLHWFGMKAGVVKNAFAVHDRGERSQSGDSRIRLKCIGVKVRLSNPSHCFALRSILSPLELIGMGMKNISLIPIRYIPELVSHYGQISEYRKFSKQEGAFLTTSSAGSMEDRKLFFLFPSKAHKPVGGVKIALEYANRFAEDGYQVGLLYPIHIYGKRNIFRRLYDIMRYIKFRSRFSVNSWFPLNDKIEETVLYDFRKLPEADIYICTSVETAIALNSAEKARGARCFYFIQGFENWNVTTDELLKTYHYPFTKIAIAPHLVEIVRKEREECLLAPNGFDPKEFNISIPIESKEPATVSILYHTQETKDFKTGLKALEIAHEKHPELKALVFGAYLCEDTLPEWCEFYFNPDKATHNKINNRAAIYLGPSRLEGFSLTIGEAMMCGQAVVCTDIPGYSVLAHNKETALVSPIGDAQALADNIITLIERPDLRMQIARTGHELIADYTYDKAYARFKSFIS